MSRLLCRFSFQWTTGCGPIGSQSFVHWKLIAHGLGVWITNWICMFGFFGFGMIHIQNNLQHMYSPKCT